MPRIPPQGMQRIIPYLAYADAPAAVSEPEDAHGDRRYRAMDPEGHRWVFATPLDDDAAGEVR